MCEMVRKAAADEGKAPVRFSDNCQLAVHFVNILIGQCMLRYTIYIYIFP